MGFVAEVWQPGGTIARLHSGYGSTTTLGVVLGLRLAKAALLQSEFRNRAGEGRERQ